MRKYKLLLAPFIFVAMWNIIFYTTENVVWVPEIRSYMSFCLALGTIFMGAMLEELK